MARRIGIAMVVVGIEWAVVIIEEEGWEEGCSPNPSVAVAAERGISGKQSLFLCARP